MTPSYNAKTSRWEMGPLLPSQVDSVGVVPGLEIRLIGEATFLTGKMDAMAAAYKRLGLGIPDFFMSKAKIALPVTGAQLREYQLEGVKRVSKILITSGGAILADDMGLGKTRQAAVLASGVVGRKFIVCPASVRETWRRELVTNLGINPERVAVLGPPSTNKYTKEWALLPTAEWIVTSYELHRRAIELGFKGRRLPTFLIIDEAHGVKGRDSIRSKEIEQLARLVSFRLALTGTPVWDRPRDLYQLLKIIHGQRMWGSGYEFDSTYCNGQHDSYGGWNNKGASNSEELKLRLSYYMLRREKRDVLTEMPALQREVLWMDPTDGARRAMQAFSMKAIRLPEALQATLEAKKDEAVRLATMARRFLLTTWMKRDASWFYQRLNRDGVPCNLITGDVDHKTRQALLDDARENGKGVVATVDSIGVGVDGLQHIASVGIFHAIGTKPMQMLQAEDRLNRLGQKEPVTWYYLAMRDTADELMVKLITTKLDQVRRVMGEGATTELRGDLADNDTDESVEAELRSLYEGMTNGPVSEI